MIVIIVIGCCIIAAVVSGVRVGRNRQTDSWILLFYYAFVTTTVVMVGGFVLQEWVDWKSLDNQQAASISSGKIIGVTRDREYVTYEVDFGGGHTGRFSRGPFEITWLEALALGVVSGVGAGITICTTATLIAKLRRGMLTASECHTCGYNLTGNVSGICPECGKPIHPTSHIAPPRSSTSDPPVQSPPS